MRWLVTSIVLSVVLTIVLNLVLRTFPGLPARLGRALEGRTCGARGRPDGTGARRSRVIFPWRAMLLVSLVGTVVLNVLLNLR